MLICISDTNRCAFSTTDNDCVVFVLGDIGQTSDQRIQEIFEQLNGSKVLIKGNLDTLYSDQTLSAIFDQIHHLLEIEV